MESKPNTGTEVKTSVTKETPKSNSFEEDLNAPYTDKRTVTISLVHNYSNYRKANMKVLGQRRETIGSCIRSCQVLSSNAKEVDAYFPALIGISPNNPDYITRVKAWLSNIQFTISENDVSLNTSFVYDHKKDYLEIQRKENAINAEYDKVDRSNTSAIKDALKKKIEALNALESTKYQYGHPEDIEAYLMYRHCLLYKEVAKDVALINSDPTIRFYIKDEAREQERQKKLTKERSDAMANFVRLSDDNDKFDSVFVAISIIRNDNLAEAMLKDHSVKQSIVMDFVNTNPDKFNKLVSDKNIQMKAFIETLITRGELVRSEFNQQISLPDGTFVGANMNETIAWFNNDANKAVRTALENKLKLN